MKLRQTLLIILLATIATATAKNMIIKEYTTENGLLHNTVYSVMKDADGFVWFGTWYGLTSFDAVKFKPYNTRGDYNTDIPPHKLQNLYEAPDGNLWVKTIDHKLFLFDKKNELFFDVFNVIRKKYSVSSKIIKIQPSESGNLLMLTKNKDLLQGRSTGNGEMEVELLYDSKSTRENKLINNLLVENQQYINWIGIDYKIISVAKGKNLQGKPADYLLQQLGPKNRLAFTAAHNDRHLLWLGTRDGMIYSVDAQNGKVKRWEQFSGSGIIENVISSGDQVVYLTIRSKGIFALNIKTGETTQVASLSAAQPVTNSCTDSYDKLWFIIDERDVLYYDPFNRIQKLFQLPEGKVNRTIKFQDGKEEGMFFLTTAGDILTIDRNELNLNLLSQHPDLNGREERPLFLDFLLDADNILWLTSTTRGVFRINFPKAQFELRKLPAGNGK
ncbi:MAG: hybrid sensor histidine kinase/response regulator, partial [Bacteroidales bacterium]|nr:hybrid sensor histidine kinase/response regulator [Bacteroidales bacterium]